METLGGELSGSPPAGPWLTGSPRSFLLQRSQRPGVSALHDLVGSPEFVRGDLNRGLLDGAGQGLQPLGVPLGFRGSPWPVVAVGGLSSPDCKRFLARA